MSIRISQGGRLFAIIAGLGGTVMSSSAGLTWTTAVFRSTDYLRYDIKELRDADRRAMLLLGLLVIVGAACFIAVESRRMRMTAGALVVLAAAAGLAIALLADPPSLAGIGLPCTNAPRPTCPTHVSEGDGPVWAGLGAVLAAGFGIVALLRSGGDSPPPPAAGRSPIVTLDATPAGDVATPHTRRMSDAALLTLIVVPS